MLREWPSLLISPCRGSLMPGCLGRATACALLKKLPPCAEEGNQPDFPSPSCALVGPARESLRN